MRRNWYYRMLFTYIPILIIVSFCLLFIYFRSLSLMNRDQALQANERMASDVAQQLDGILRSINDLITRESMDEAVTSFFSARGQADDFTTYKAFTKVNDLLAYHEIIDSIYLVHALREDMISNYKAMPLAQFYDRDYVERSFQDGRFNVWSLPRTLPNPNRPLQVITLKKQARISDPSGMIIVNVNLNKIKQLLVNSYQADVTQIRILDEQGTLLLDNGKGEQRKNDEVLSSRLMAVTGWTVQTGFNQAGFYEMASLWLDAGTILAILFVVIGSASIVIMTRRHYRPVQQIMQRILTSPTGLDWTTGANHNEMKVIDQAIAQMVQYSSQLEQKYKKEQLRNGQHLLREVLLGTRRMEQSLWEEWQKLSGFGEQLQEAQALVVEIDDPRSFSRNFSIKDQALLKFALENVLQEWLKQEEGHCEIVWVTESRLCGVVLRTNGGDSSLFLTNAEQFRAWVGTNMKLTITIGCGRPLSVQSGLQESFRQAQEALQYKIILGTDRVISYENVYRGDKNDLQVHLSVIQSLVSALSQGEPTWRDHLQRLQEIIKLGWLNREMALQLISYANYMLDKHAGKLPSELNRSWKEQWQHELDQAMEENDTLDGIFANYSRIFSEMEHAVKLARHANKHHATMTSVKSFIEDHYSDPGLSLEMLSDKFEVSDKYLSKLFKEEFGSNFVDFLAKLRIEHGKKLLENEDNTISDIAAKVGYTTTITFSRAFKRQEGMTPSAYRALYFT